MKWIMRIKSLTQKYIMQIVWTKIGIICILVQCHFSDQEKDCDELHETKDGHILGSGIASLLRNHLDDSYEVVSLQELMWQLRMKFYPEQTKKYLKSIL